MNNLKFKVFDKVKLKVGVISSLDGVELIVKNTIEHGDFQYVVNHEDVDYYLMEYEIEPVTATKEKTSKEQIETVCDNLKSLLLYKNEKYGDSALHPIKVFSKASAETGLLQRLDDKIARIKNSPEIRLNDTVDIAAYCILLCVSRGWTDFDKFKD